MDRLQEILESKEFKNISPLSDYKIERLQKMSSSYIFFTQKDKKHGICENCLKDVVFEKNTVHKKQVECPSCKKKMSVEHVWRKKGCDHKISWFAEGKTISKDVFVIRYYAAEQGVLVYWNKNGYRNGDGYKKTIKEEAREIFDFKTGNRFKLSHTSVGWVKDSYHFYENTMGYWGIRKEFCRQAKILQTREQALKEISKIECLKYYDVDRKLASHWVWGESLYGLLSAPLYEKMEKVGLNDMTAYDFGRKEIKWNRKETSLVKMLKLDKMRYKKFLSNPRIYVLSFLQNNRKLSERDMDYILDLGDNGVKKYNKLKSMGFFSPVKGIKYLEKSKVNIWEYTHYLDLLKDLGYDMKDESYVFPKDFRKEDDRITEEYRKREEARRKAEKEEYKRQLRERDGKIAAISEGLRKMDNLKEFLDGAKGLFIYVPESAKEMEREGRNLHNCLSTYPDRVAEKKTLIFFVRRLEAPNDPFIAFEYCNGEIVQCRYDHNEAVKNDEKGAKILNFVDAFAERLRQNKVLVAA